jgi:hypothetical protein
MFTRLFPYIDTCSTDSKPKSDTCSTDSKPKSDTSDEDDSKPKSDTSDEDDSKPKSDTTSDEAYVLSVNGHPYAIYRDLVSTQNEMREIARSMCLVKDTYYQYSVHHLSDVAIDVVKRLINALVTYDSIVGNLSIEKVPIKNTFLTK